MFLPEVHSLSMTLIDEQPQRAVESRQSGSRQLERPWRLFDIREDEDPDDDDAFDDDDVEGDVSDDDPDDFEGYDDEDEDFLVDDDDDDSFDDFDPADDET